MTIPQNWGVDWRLKFSHQFNGPHHERHAPWRPFTLAP